MANKNVKLSRTRRDVNPWPWPWPKAEFLGLGAVRPWPRVSGLGLECSGLGI